MKNLSKTIYGFIRPIFVNRISFKKYQNCKNKKEKIYSNQIQKYPFNASFNHDKKYLSDSVSWGTSVVLRKVKITLGKSKNKVKRVVLYGGFIYCLTLGVFSSLKITTSPKTWYNISSLKADARFFDSNLNVNSIDPKAYFNEKIQTSVIVTNKPDKVTFNDFLIKKRQEFLSSYIKFVDESIDDPDKFWEEFNAETSTLGKVVEEMKVQSREARAKKEEEDRINWIKSWRVESQFEFYNFRTDDPIQFDIEESDID